jgi:DNA-binding NarL/FixJ family response regulator
MNPDVTLLIADDHEIFRDGIALMISRQSDIHLIGQAEDGQQLIELAHELKPDVIMTDIKMPGIDGIEATKILKQEYPDVKIIALSMFDEENLIIEMLEAGAKGYLLKNADKQEILDAVFNVYKGDTYYCRHTSARLATLIVKSRFNPYKMPEPVTFSERETDIIRLICFQHTAQEIADKLFLSKRTIEGYRTKILEKIKAKNIAGVVMYALKQGIVSEEEISG